MIQKRSHFFLKKKKKERGKESERIAALTIKFLALTRKRNLLTFKNTTVV
jgi:hypothetical protein